MPKSDQTNPPRVVRPEEWDVRPDEISPGCHITAIVEGEQQHVGIYFIPPGVQTNHFSLEDQDDGTADEWYGPSDEFYYVLVGELTMFWGSDADAVREGRSEQLVLRAGDLGYWARGWKFAVKNTGTAPATFLWGLTLPPEGTPRREGP